jgi:hypothetical protein
MHRTIEAIEKHLAAIRSPLYEVGVFFPAGEGRPEPKMLLRTWDEVALRKSVPWLRAKNAEGAAIYIRPSGEHPYSLVDDLKMASIERMKADGFTPTIVVETSPGNFQAWLNHGEVLDKRTSTAAARRLSERFGGDPGAADWRHFGRLAGFTNRKPQYRQTSGLYPFVRISDHSPSIVYGGAAAFLRDLRERLQQNKANPQSTTKGLSNGPAKTIQDFRADPAYSGDGNRIDLAFAVYALAHGADEDYVRAAIQTRDLSKKGSAARQLAYLNRTIKKGRQSISTIHRER